MEKLQPQDGPDNYGDVLRLGRPVPPDANRVEFLRFILRTEGEARQLALLAYAAIVSFLSSRAEDGLLSMSDLRQARLTVRGEMQLIGEKLSRSAMKRMSEAAEYGEKTMRDLLKEKVGAVRYTKIVKDTQAINEIVARRANETGLVGEPLDDIIRRRTLDAQAAITSAINRGILSGKQASQINRDVRQAIMGEKIGGKPPPAAAWLSNVSRAIRTEFAWAYGAAQKEFARRTKEVSGFKWFLSAAHPRPDICDEFAGRFFAADDKELDIFPPHPNCLCMLVPVFQ